MTQSKAPDDGIMKQEGLPRRDWILLPLVGLLTLISIASCTELLARRIFPLSKTAAEDCMVSNDPSSGVRGIPNSVCRDKDPEGELTEYRFNGSGYRSDRQFGPKTDGTYRIVMIGTSYATGLRVPVQETFATLLPLELSKRTGRKVELYNEAIVRELPDTLALHFNEVLKAKPDMILWILTRGDIQETYMMPKVDKNPQPRSEKRSTRVWRRVNAEFRSKSFAAAIAELFEGTRTAYLLRHFLFKSQYLYVKSYLMGTDHEMGYLRASPSVEWQTRLREFESDAAEVERQSSAAGVPLVAVFLPRGPQAAMVSMDQWPLGYDPYKIDYELQSIIASHGETYINILPEFRTIPNPEQGYLRVEGHPNANGHATITRMLAEKLTDGVVPALDARAQPRPDWRKGKN